MLTLVAAGFLVVIVTVVTRVEGPDQEIQFNVHVVPSHVVPIIVLHRVPTRKP